MTTLSAFNKGKAIKAMKKDKPILNGAGMFRTEKIGADTKKAVIRINTSKKAGNISNSCVMRLSYKFIKIA
ncbi:hypothetical protein AMI01nite_11420 [Aneurinibacillus migulanus]|nr:hypothetical protein AMI01nite_11420 [Aneurinibacillus migulanus]